MLNAIRLQHHHPISGTFYHDLHFHEEIVVDVLLIRLLLFLEFYVGECVEVFMVFRSFMDFGSYNC